MALSDDIQDRIPSQVLIEATNPRDAEPTTINATILAQAASSIETRFETYAEEAYDSTVSIHVEVCVEGAMALLERWGAGQYGAAKEAWEDFREECERVKATRARARITPTSSSQLTPSEENPGGGIKRPWSDDPHFDALHTQQYGSTSDDD